MQLPEPRLWLVHDPDDRPESTRLINGLGDVDQGRVLARITPGG